MFELLQRSLWARGLVILHLQNTGVIAVSESQASGDGKKDLVPGYDDYGSVPGSPGFLSVTVPLNSTTSQRKAAWMLLESVGSVLERTAKDPEYNPESALTTLSHAMETQIIQNKALGLEKHAGVPYGEAEPNENLDNTLTEDENFLVSNLAEAANDPSSFAQETEDANLTEEEKEKRRTKNCSNKKLCFICNGGYVGFYITFKHIGTTTLSQDDKCRMNTAHKLMKGTQESVVPLTGSFGPKHPCRKRLQKHDSSHSANLIHTNKMDEIIDSMKLGPDMVVEECDEACHVAAGKGTKFTFNNDPNVAKGYSLSMRQCEKTLPQAGACGYQWHFILVIALCHWLQS